MKIEFKSKSLKKVCINKKKARKKYGKKVAKKLFQRIYELQAFENLKEVPHTPPFRKHKLRGKYSGCFAIDLSGNYRLVFKPACNFRQKEELNLKDVDKIIVWEVIDYHG